MNTTRAAFTLLCISIAGTFTASAQLGIAGKWEGAIVLPGVNLGIIVHFRGPDSDVKGTIDIPMQMAKGLPLKNITVEESQVNFELPAGPGLALFDGRRQGDSLKGEFHQGGVTATFYLARTGQAEATVAEVAPPYHVEEVRIENGVVILAGTLTRPEGRGPFPAVILLTGSGAQDRNEEIFGFEPFRILADSLTRSGFAVLRCDDRGVGGSTGSVTTSTTEDFAGDALAMRRFLNGLPEIDSTKVGYLGHSEGASVAVMAAARSPQVAFIVLLAGPSIPGDSLVLYQMKSLAKERGQPEEETQRGVSLERQALATAKSGEGWEALRTAFESEIRHGLDRLPPDQKAAITDSAVSARVQMQIDAMRSPWFRFFISYDPSVDLRRVKCPVLALFAELDRQVPPALNRLPMEQAFAAGGNTQFEISIIPGANHLFQQARTGSPTEYAGLEKEFVNGLLGRIIGWLKKWTQ